jgi:processive 1,2-diacylglycerol beta-glucosyltransferase
MIHLTEKATGSLIGTITEGQLQFLVDQLEEEWLEDRDYSITPLLLSVFEAEGKEPELVALLKGALGDREEIEVVWGRG